VVRHQSEKGDQKINEQRMLDLAKELDDLCATGKGLLFSTADRNSMYFVCGGMLFARAPLVDEPDRYYPAPEDWRDVTAKAWHDEYDRRYKAQQEQGG